MSRGGARGGLLAGGEEVHSDAYVEYGVRSSIATERLLLRFVGRLRCLGSTSLWKLDLILYVMMVKKNERRIQGILDPLYIHGRGDSILRVVSPVLSISFFLLTHDTPSTSHSSVAAIAGYTAWQPKQTYNIS